MAFCGYIYRDGLGVWYYRPPACPIFPFKGFLLAFFTSLGFSLGEAEKAFKRGF